MRTAITAGAALLALAGCTAGPGHGGDPGAVMGSQARAKHGADPLAKPPEGVGEAEDPAGAAPPVPGTPR